MNDDTIAAVKDRADILEVISADVQVKKAGRNYQACCPFHNEKTPSFSIDPDKQFFHCFGCGISGDVISYVQQYDNISFKEAVEKLAQRYGIPIRDFSDSHPVTEDNPNAPADAYMEKVRGFKPEVTQGMYELAFAYKKDVNAYANLVEFPLSNGNKWGRIIDESKIKLFNGKGYFKGGYREHGWIPENFEIPEDKKVYICEGIFKSLAFIHIGKASISGMSSGNLPIEIIKRFKDEDITWILAIDNDTAGIKSAEKFGPVLKQMGLKYQVAIPESKYSDWDDLYKQGKLDENYIEDSLWRGRYILSKSSSEKSFWHWSKYKKSYHLFNFKNSLWTYNYSKSDNESIGGEKYWLTVDDHEVQNFMAEFISDTKISKISNCFPELLYMENCRITKEQSFFFKITYENGNQERRINLPGSILKSSTSLNEALLNKGFGGTFDGELRDIKFLRNKYLGYEFKGKIIDTIPFIGYDRESKAYIYPDFAYCNNKYIPANDHDCIPLKDRAVKTTQSIKVSDNRNFDGSWFTTFYKCHGIQAIPILAWWIGSGFAEQFRYDCPLKFYPFLEVVGEGGSGKSNIVKFLWKSFGRDNYEGFNPSKASETGWLREIQQVSNMPTVLLEAFSDSENPKKGAFKRDDLKPLLDGVSPRVTGVKSNDNRTQAERFRAAVMMVHNPVDTNGDEATETRFIQIELNAKRHNKETEKYFLELNKMEVEELSGLLHKILSNETKLFNSIIDTYFQIKERFDQHYKFKQRISACHALVASCCRNLPLIFGDYVTDEIINEAEDFLLQCALDRQAKITGDSPDVSEFWDFYEHIEQKSIDETGEGKLNHSIDPNIIAVRLTEFVEKCNYYNLKRFSLTHLKRILKNSRSRKFIESSRSIKSKRTDKAVRCWIFEKSEK